MHVEGVITEQAVAVEGFKISGSNRQAIKRVMLISSKPERVRSLLIELSSACFDVFSLQEFHSNMLPALDPELLIYDGVLEGEAERKRVLKHASAAGVPVLMLLNQQSYEAAQGYHVRNGSEMLKWPQRTELIMHRVHWVLNNKPLCKLAQPNEDIRMFKDIMIDLKRMTVDQNGRRIDLTKMEYDLLLHFITSDGSVLGRESLLDAIWGVQFFGGSNVVDVHIKSLRKKLKDSAVCPKYIVTVRGAGYRLADDRDGKVD